MTLRPEAIIGRYRILSLVGHGGMADVYKAHQPSLDRIVALKVIRPGLTDDPTFAERFAREARAIAKLEHPNIVPVFDFEEVDGRSILVMQYLDAGTLKDRLLVGRGPLTTKEVARIVRGIADALDHAHGLGIIHRDVKPSNVMLTAGGRVMVTDFGIAKMLGTATTQYTQTGVGVGTPDYMSPEQGQALPVDRRSDVYALGAVAYEMLTGRVPFLGDTPIAVMLKHIREPLPRPSELNPAIGLGTEAVLAKAMAKVRDERYATAGEFADALETSLTAPVGAPAGAPPAPRARSSLALILSVLGLFVVLGGGAALATTALNRLPAASPPAAAGAALPSVTPSASPAAAVVTGPASPPPARTSVVLPAASNIVSSCAPAVVTGGGDVICRFTGLPAGQPMSLRIQYGTQQAATVPMPPNETVVPADGTWEFHMRTNAASAGMRIVVALTAGSTTSVMQFDVQ